MKQLFTYIILAFLIFHPVNVFSQSDWNITKNLFSYARVEKDVNDFSENAASVSYKGRIFYFVSYGKNNQVVVREIVNDSLSVNSFFPKETAHYEILYNGIVVTSQLAPVVFNGVLYLFFDAYTTLNNNSVGYVTYDDILQKWSAPIMYPESEQLHLDAGSVVVVDNKLCMISHHKYNKVSLGSAIYEENHEIRWTTDPNNLYGWSVPFLLVHAIPPCSNVYNQYTGYSENLYFFTPISAICQNYINESGITSQKLIVASVTYSRGPTTASDGVNVAQYKFDSTGALYEIRSDNIKTDGINCSIMAAGSVALVQGSVEKDPASSGNCTQLFVTNAYKDNSKYNRYRILRFQLKEGETEWEIPEDNVVPLNSPLKMWADGRINLTAVNYDVLDPTYNQSNVQRYIVLLYRGNTDNNNPLLSAWVKSDYLKYTGDHVQDLDDLPSQRQYLGYIEGPPPYFKNTPYTLVNESAENISELEFTNAKSTDVDNKISFETSSSLTVHIPYVSAEIGYIQEEANKKNTKITYTNAITLLANEKNLGLYIYQAPRITLSEYFVYDWKRNNPLYSSFNFSMATILHTEAVPLGDSLNSCIPQTFMSQNRKINFNDYFSVTGSSSAPSVSWSEGTNVSTEIEIEKGQEVSNSTKKSFKLSAELGHYFSSELEKSIEYETTTTTVAANKVKCNTRLNAPVTSQDLKKLEYDVYWIKRSPGARNWWVPDSTDEAQNIWCITYKVTKMVFENDSTIQDFSILASSKPRQDTASLNLKPVLETPKTTEPNQMEQEQTPLAQNSPNPFRGSTKIKYTVGIENLPANSTDCLTRLVIYNLGGQQVATLVNENKAPGSYEVEWDASQFTPGVYFYSLQSGSFKDVKKLVLLK